MLESAFRSRRMPTLLGEYSTLLGEAVLRNRAHWAEQMARIEAERASKIKSEFIANVSHELRTPLNSIIGFSALLQEADKRQLKLGQVIEYAGMINEAAEHLLAIINDILEMSKIQSGRFSIELEDVNVTRILQRSLPLLALAAQEAGVELHASLDENIEPIRGDEVRLRQCFLNLISNAIKFTPHGGKVSVSAERAPDGGAHIAVRDNGIGMTPHEVEVALMPFGQVDGSRSRSREGTGLGLPIAKALIELHGGTFRVSSAKGEGTEIQVTLPPKNPEAMTGPDERHGTHKRLVINSEAQQPECGAGSLAHRNANQNQHKVKAVS